MRQDIPVITPQIEDRTKFGRQRHGYVIKPWGLNVPFDQIDLFSHVDDGDKFKLDLSVLDAVNLPETYAAEAISRTPVQQRLPNLEDG